MSRGRVVLLPVLLAAAWAALFAGDALWGGSTWFFHDLRHHHYPWRAWASRTWASGEIPLWAPIAHGYPLMADGQAGVLYPPNIVLQLLLPEKLAFNWSIALHQMGALLGGYALARTLGRSVPASVFAGLAYGASGFVVSHLVYLGMYEVLAWIPWMIAFTVLAVTSGGAWPVLAGVAIACAWLAGHPQLALYGTYATAVVGLFTVKNIANWRAGAMRMAIICAISMAIALPQLLASAELVAFGGRDGGVDETFASLGALPPEEIANFALPDWLGVDRPADVQVTYHHRAGNYAGRGVSYWEDCVFLGVTTLLLGALAGRARRTWVWWGFAVAGLLAMLGAATPFFPLLRLFPGMGWFRFPVRYAVWVALAMSQLAAMGLDRLYGARGLDHRRWSRFVLVLAAVGFGCAALLNVAIAYLEPTLVSGLSKLVHASPDDTLSAVGRAGLFLDQIERSVDPFSARVLLPVGTIVTAGLLIEFSTRDGAWSWLRTWGWHALLVAELLPLTLGFNPRVSAPNEPPAVASAAIDSTGLFRMAVLDRRVPEELDPYVMSANLGLLFGAEDTIVPSPLRMLRNERWLERVGLDLSLGSAEEKIRAFEEHRVLADLSGIRFLLTTHELALPDLRLVREEKARSGETVRLYENDRALPRAFAVGCTVPVAVGAEEELDAVLALSDPWSTAVVSGAGLERCAPGAVGEVSASRDGASTLLVQADLPSAAFLVVTETWYPGMRFVVDGQTKEPLRTDFLFMGIALSPGRHAIRVEYAPQMLYAAMALATGVLLASLVGCAMVTRRPT